MSGKCDALPVGVVGQLRGELRLAPCYGFELRHSTNGLQLLAKDESVTRMMNDYHTLLSYVSIF